MPAAFPDRPDQAVVEVRPLPSRQHEMVAFALNWMAPGGDLQREGLVVRRYVSTISWWRTEDRGKAQREVTVCRWLLEQGFPVPVVYAREFGPSGDMVLFSRLPSQEMSISGRHLRDIVEPYIAPFAVLLARLHSLTPPDAVRRVAPQVTLPSALANLMALAFQIKQDDLRQAVERTMMRAYDVQESSPVLVHGDYHFLNALLVDREISGIVDWEYCALGDPRWDVANTYMQLVDFGAAEAADRFLAIYLRESGREFAGPPVYNAAVPLQQWAIAEWLVQRSQEEATPGFALARDLITLRDVHRHRAQLAMQWLE